jgi:hypothetical protein
MLGAFSEMQRSLLKADLAKAAVDWLAALRADPKRLRRLAYLGGSAVLFVWFAYWTYRVCSGNFTAAHRDTLGIDGRLYYRAAHDWLAGGDPWNTFVTKAGGLPSQQIHSYFTGPPPTVLAFVPLTILPESLFVPFWLVLTVLAAFYILRRLHLPFWWLLFPPLAQGIVYGNPHVVALALLVAGSSWLGALAAPIKAYAVFPLLGELRWRALAILAVAGTISLVLFWPLWHQYLLDYRHVQDWIVATTHGGFSAFSDSRLIPPTILAVAAIAYLDRRKAGWLVVPALWPASEFFYATFAMPVAPPVLVFFLAVPRTWSAPVAICLYAAWLVAARLRKEFISRRGAGRTEPADAAELRPVTAAEDRPVVAEG